MNADDHKKAIKYLIVVVAFLLLRNLLDDALWILEHLQ